MALIVEQYKEQTRLIVQEEREKAERLLKEAVAKETEKCQELLQNQHDRCIVHVYMYIHVVKEKQILVLFVCY